ncbi:hypothetical protein [Micromonospora sp. KC723]|uniref:hypothetical protein n=1 Tax=Micromonospora sp. KC723 TaxID=2530381 RepID=UPI00104FB354|nr:hypothetical protein [Micromonospora sp. KC723]TDB71450.1 hypothetical protein E1165_22965 [Micromonospora sp. KC723]
MNAHRLDLETVERLLDDPVVDPRDGPQPLLRLLAAVRAAPRPAELRGESAAVRAFHGARAGGPAAGGHAGTPASTDPPGGRQPGCTAGEGPRTGW